MPYKKTTSKKEKFGKVLIIYMFISSMIFSVMLIQFGIELSFGKNSTELKSTFLGMNIKINNYEKGFNPLEKTCEEYTKNRIIDKMDYYAKQYVLLDENSSNSSVINLNK